MEMTIYNALQRFNAAMDLPPAVTVPQGDLFHISCFIRENQIIIPRINIYWRPRVQKEPTISKDIPVLVALIILIAIERMVIIASLSTCIEIVRVQAFTQLSEITILHRKMIFYYII